MLSKYDWLELKLSRTKSGKKHPKLWKGIGIPNNMLIVGTKSIYEIVFLQSGSKWKISLWFYLNLLNPFLL